jgi:hypothetical protein
MIKSKRQIKLVNEEYAGFLVVCGDDGGQPLRRVLATRQVFATYESAVDYAKGVSKSRHPQIIGCIRPVKIERQ